jgi:endo-1,4-beta-xylanase
MKKKLMPIGLVLAGALAGCATPHNPAPVTLKVAFKNDFLIGAALNPSQFCELNHAEAALVKQQFNSISPENILKWEKIHPAPGRYDFTLADRYVNFGVENKMFIVGHNLVWHEQTPKWVFQDETGNPVSREVLLARMREHIFAVVGRYRGKIGGWDVVNEALNEDGTLRTSPWRKMIGDDYLLQAYQFAHEADPAAELYYNDYSLENPAKRAGALALIRKLQAQGVKISGVGLQGHYNLDFPTLEQFDATITAFARLGVKVMITELDVDVLPRATRDVAADVSKNVQRSENLNPYSSGLPDALQRQLAERYADLFAVLVRHRNDIGRVTFWGVTDGDSWLNNWPVNGRTSYPLLFDRAGRPKPAFDSVITTAGR